DAAAAPDAGAGGEASKGDEQDAEPAYSDADDADATRPLLSGVRAAAAGAYSHGVGFVCAIYGPGVACWGENSFGQLGNNSTINSARPVQVMSLEAGVTGIAAGRAHTCAIDDHGAAWCWGSNTAGQLGNGTILNSPTPVAVHLDAGATAI